MRSRKARTFLCCRTGGRSSTRPICRRVRRCVDRHGAEDLRRDTQAPSTEAAAIEVVAARTGFDYVGFNGRWPPNDVMDVMLSLMTNTAVGDGVAPEPGAYP